MEKIDFFQLLILNNQNDIKNFLMTNGKSPKPICPIRFIKEYEENI